MDMRNEMSNCLWNHPQVIHYDHVLMEGMEEYGLRKKDFKGGEYDSLKK